MTELSPTYRTPEGRTYATPDEAWAAADLPTIDPPTHNDAVADRIREAVKARVVQRTPEGRFYVLSHGPGPDKFTFMPGQLVFDESTRHNHPRDDE
ncbi:hypothetical protein [Propionibacterium freudenreichii]|uniref:hypothetical protein n=1 Tax=Propionibacterium freudenreichii TaxID=1744 RepID=UPI000542E95C|nr:hypothetical protein [Propionibacterium freudenreichii]CEH00476.1 Protein of unknown function [Propionibacterium freudenreichii]